jgi:RNA polymerase sigma-70 factor (ECF subfamily)
VDRSDFSRRELDEAIDSYRRLRPRLFGIAYRITGNWTEAEDIVQDVWVRWQSCDRRVVVNPTAFLVTTTTRLAINNATSARARRVSPVGEWARDAAGDTPDPALGTERRDALEKGLTLLLERLSATERAAFILRVAFDYPYSRIAVLLRLSEVNARQVVSRATRNIATANRRPVNAGERRQLVRTFSTASGGDCASLEGLLVAGAAS